MRQLAVLPVGDEEAAQEGQQEQKHGHKQLELFILILVFSSTLKRFKSEKELETLCCDIFSDDYVILLVMLCKIK